MNRKLSLLLTCLLIIVTCFSCKKKDNYLIEDYLLELANQSGISDKKIYDNAFNDLKDWGIVDEEDFDKRKDYLKYDYLIKTISRLIEEEETKTLNKLGYKNKINLSDFVYKEDALKIIALAIKEINHKTFNSNYYYEESKEVKEGTIKLIDGEYKKENEEVEFEDVFEELDIEETFDIDYEDIEIIPYGNEYTETNYINNRYKLLSNNKKVYEINGYKVTFQIKKSGININITKKKDSGLTIYGDININGIQPSVKWHSKKDDVENAYFRLDFNTNEKFGIKNEKYKKYNTNFKDLDASSFMNLLNSMIKKEDDEVEARLPICKIKIPIEAIPTADIYLDLSLNLSARGNIELSLVNKHNIGFEIKEGKARFINENQNDFDLVGQAEAKTGLNIDLSLEAVNKRLMDLNTNAGLNSNISTIINLYDNEGNLSKTNTDLAYSTLKDISKENNNVKICADIHAGMYLDLAFNSSKTLLSKFGLSKKINLINNDNKKYGFNTHIENGIVVEKCTQKSKDNIQINNEEINVDKLLLNKTAIVLRNNSSYEFEFSYFPKDYTLNDLIYEIEDDNIVRIEGINVYPVGNGNTRIKISTKDNKYYTYLNCLVSLDAYNN